MFKHNEAFSFQIATDDQDETDRYWNAIVGNGGQESACGWCKDKWGISWQITPHAHPLFGQPDRCAPASMSFVWPPPSSRLGAVSLPASGRDHHAARPRIGY